MNTSRVINIVLCDLSNDNLKLQEDLEMFLNSHVLNIDDKVTKIKSLLEKLALNEMMLGKLNGFLSDLNNEQQKSD